MEKIKILMVLGNTGRGGSQAYAMNILRNINREKFQIDFAVAYQEDNDYSEEIESLGSTIYILPYFKVYNYFTCVGAWNSFFKRHHYDIVHGHSTNSAFLYLKVAKSYGCVTITHSHSAGYRGNFLQKLAKKIFAKRASKYADYLFACSDKAAERLYGMKYKELPNYYDIPNAINTEKFLYDKEIRKKIRNQLEIEEDELLIGHVGTFSKPKNHTFLIDIFQEIIKRNSKCKLVLCGDGYLKNLIIKKVSDYNLGSKVIFTGNVTNTNEYFMAMDLLLFPSLFEGFPVTIIEAEASGLNILQSDTITNDVIITDLVKKYSLINSPSQWAEQALECNVIRNRTKYNDMLSESDYNINKSINNLTELYVKMYYKVWQKPFI